MCFRENMKFNYTKFTHSRFCANARTMYEDNGKSRIGDVSSFLFFSDSVGVSLFLFFNLKFYA